MSFKINSVSASAVIPQINYNQELTQEIEGNDTTTPNASKQSTPPETITSWESNSGSMLAGNFVKQTSEQSKYTTAALLRAQLSNPFTEEVQSIVDTYKIEAESTENYAEKVLAGKKAAKATERFAQKKVSEEEAKRMEEERKKAEEEEKKKAEEKANGTEKQTDPKDIDKTIEDQEKEEKLSAEKTGKSSVEDVATTVVLQQATKEKNNYPTDQQARTASSGVSADSHKEASDRAQSISIFV